MKHKLLKKDNLTIGFIILIILAIPVTLFLLSRPSDQRSRAAFVSSEPENGTRTGSVTVGTDSSASNGQYVQFGP